MYFGNLHHFFDFIYGETMLAASTVNQSCIRVFSLEGH